MVSNEKEWLEQLFKHIEHGDEEHRAWLKAKLDEMESSLKDFVSQHIERYQNHQQGRHDARLWEEVPELGPLK